MLIHELRKYRWKRGRKQLTTRGSLLNPQVAQPIPLKLEDDTADALRYMLHTVLRTRIDTAPTRTRREREVRKSIQVANEVVRIRGDQPHNGNYRHSFGGRFSR